MENLLDDIAEFLAILNKTEISEFGKKFHPTSLHSCRVMDGKRGNEILKKLEKAVKSGEWVIIKREELNGET